MTRLTVGMATYDDFDGCYFTIQALRLYHPEVEIVVVDNNPVGSHASMLQGLCMHSGAKYYPLASPVGTSPSRDRVFKAASGDFVLCMDSHVLLHTESIANLLYDLNTGQLGNNIYSGPMMMDDLKGICTHFIPQWRSEMFGIWGRAWQCPCGDFVFSSYQKDDQFIGIEFPMCEVSKILDCPKCGKKLPDSAWSGHEAILEREGYIAPDQPFEIPGQGLGCFGCLKDAWPGFVEGAIGFGGEELNIHELFRQRGDKAICLPYLKWLHRFGRPGGVPYPLQKWHKVRNSVLWHQRLGKSLDDIHHHFVSSRLISPADWDYLIADPLNHTTPPSPSTPPCGNCNTPASGTIEEVYQRHLTIPRDFEKHMPKLRELADQCQTVTDISIRQESFLALAASKAETVYSYSSEENALTQHVLSQKSGSRRRKLDPSMIMEIGETDLLFLNTKHHGHQVLQELIKFAPKTKHYIVLHNTTIYGEAGEGWTDTNPVPGILVAVRKFCRENPQWSVIYHTADQYGLTVLSCLPEDKKRLPGIARKAVNFTKALTEHIADGAKKAELPIMESRLDICAGCDQRTDGNCSVCGCDLATKASWRTSECPLGFWPE